jgi:hypothetical protein
MSADDLAAIRADLDRAREGRDVTAALLAHAARLHEMSWSDERYAVERVVQLALLAAPSRRGVDAVIARSLPIGMLL